jgi:4-methylaminobutanoate oxidase (formaldehyde-forming)
VPGLTPHLAVMRDGAACSYFRGDGEASGGLVRAGGQALGMKGIPETFCFDQLPDDFEHIEPQLNAAIQRVPALGKAGIQLFFNGPESFTPDDRYLLGETPEVWNLFIAAGFISIGVQSADGAGKMLADRILDGYPPVDLCDVDIRRMMPL